MASRLLLRHGRTWQHSLRVYGTSPLWRPRVSAAARQNLPRFRQIRSTAKDTSDSLQLSLTPHASIFRISTVGVVAAFMANSASNMNIVADAPPIQTNLIPKAETISSSPSTETISSSPSKGAARIDDRVDEERKGDSGNQSIATNEEDERHRSTLLQVLDLMSKVSGAWGKDANQCVSLCVIAVCLRVITVCARVMHHCRRHSIADSSFQQTSNIPANIPTNIGHLVTCRMVGTFWRRPWLPS